MTTYLRACLFFGAFSAATASTAIADGAVIVANKAAGYDTGMDAKSLMRIFRGMDQATPSGASLTVYLPPPGTPANEVVLQGVLQWNESQFERQVPLVERKVGRALFLRTALPSDVAGEVAGNPGAIGVLDGASPIPSGVVVIWKSD